MSYKKYILHVSTNWCGEDQDYAIIKDENSNIDDFCQNIAWENFTEFEGIDAILEELFPEAEGDYTEEQRSEAEDKEEDYYTWSLDEFNEDGETKWEWFELILDESSKNI